MAHRHMKRCSASLAIGEMQIKTTMRYYLTPVWISIINKSTNIKCWQGCGEKRTLVHCWWECKLVQPLWKTSWNFLKNLKMELPFDPAIPLLGIYPKNPESLIQKNLCTPMFIEMRIFVVLIREPRLGHFHLDPWELNSSHCLVKDSMSSPTT